MQKINNPYWYRSGWSLDIKNESWVEDTVNQVDFIIKALNLTGTEKILDLACGFGRHSLEFAKRGYSVVGIDLTKEYIDDAKKTAQELSLNCDFLNLDIREVAFKNEFDVVLNLADGAIGYLENDEENLKIFDVISNALKPSGKHFMDICRAEHAEYFFPKRYWEIGSKSLALAEFDWDKEKRKMYYSGWDIPYGEPAQKPELPPASGTRLYSLEEIKEIMLQRDMTVISTYSDYYGSPQTYKEMQLMVCSQKGQG